MADKGNTNMPSSGGSSGTPQSRTRTSATLAGVRRNLFQSQQARTRRPGPSTSNSSEALRMDAESSSGDPSEIVVRDSHGEIELGDPPTPDPEEDAETMQDDTQEREQERQRLAEAVKHHQINNTTVPEQPEELLEAVRASLRTKTSALAEDNWMYEAEELGRGP